ncbi:MAG: hypothetical protein QOK28_2215 [Actinomycetota bacterium]
MNRNRVIALAALMLAASCITVRPAAAQTDSAAVTKTKRIARVHLTNGADDVVEEKDFTLTVDQTTNLRFFQELHVSWSGAHPTGGIVADPNSGDAREEEYPVVLLQCAGDAPESCWTATAGERFASSYATAFPQWRLDRYASAEQRKAVVGEPNPRPDACFSAAPAERWVPFRGGNGVTYAGGPTGCAGMAPEAANVGGLSLPSNTTYGVTSGDGTGNAKFTVWTGENNASLACSASVACSLVAVPILGISCDVAAEGLPAEDRASDPDVAAEADAACKGTGHFKPGQIVVPAGHEDPSVAGELWWSASNWRNRVTVPLSFAPASNACDVVGAKRASLDLYGSELMTQATLQWLPKFCLDANSFNVKHVQTGEVAARSLLNSGGVDAVLSSDVPPEPFTKPVVNAPVALTAFAIAYAVDDAQGHSVGTLKLTPRLLAKLLTESYPAINAIKDDYAALAKNPLNVTLDPEFTALNPTIAQGVPASEAASTLLTLSSDSDVTVALTRYIDHDADARAWLDGAPDPWGMVVNPNYKGITLPVTSWPLLDTFEPTRLYESGTNDCLKNDPVPYLPLVAAPIARLNPIAQAMQFALAKPNTVCVQVAEGTSEGEKLVAQGRQTQGFRFMLGVVSLGDARRFALDTASLQTSGDAFVAPSDDSVVAAGQLLGPDPETNSWPIPYAKFATSDGKKAYPGTMVVYAQAPTEGLKNDDAGRIATFLDFAATDGQKSGTEVGELAPGYVPLTEANGLGGLSSYTHNAANAVRLQQASVPAVIPVDASAAAGGDESAHAPSNSAFDTANTALRSPPRVATPPNPVLGVAQQVGNVVKKVAGATAEAVAGLVAALFPLVTVAGVAAGLSALGVGFSGWRKRRWQT